MKQNLFKRVLSLILCLLMVVTAVPYIDVNAMSEMYSASSPVWPVDKGSFTITADWPRYPKGSPHTGIDLAAPIGTPIKLAYSGKLVKKNGDGKGYGNHLKFEYKI